MSIYLEGDSLNRYQRINIQEQLDGKTVDWIEKVSDEQYQALF
jgi:hypothetical protein